MTVGSFRFRDCFADGSEARTCICCMERVSRKNNLRRGKGDRYGERTWVQQRDDLYYGGDAAEVWPWRLGGGRLGAEADGRGARDARLRSRRGESRDSGTDGRADRGRRHRGGGVGPLARGAHGRLLPGGGEFRLGGRFRRVRRRGWRI